MKREVEATWAAERMENAVLRERINDVAAEVARLTVALEGPGSPIDAMLSEPARPPASGALAASRPPHTGSIANGDAAKGGSLADRIRALQQRSSRVPQASRA
jgi:hypothetical protein